MPRLNIVSGPSGAGKSTFASYQKDWTNVWNLDDIERRVGDRTTAIVKMDEGIRREIHNRREFVIDHVVDTVALETWIEPAKSAGYSTHAWLLASDKPRVHVTRVRQRRAAGGHGWADNVVEELHRHALGGFGELIFVANEAFLIESSANRPKLIAYITNFEHARYVEKAPEWAEELTRGLPVMAQTPELGTDRQRIETGWSL